MTSESQFPGFASFGAVLTKSVRSLSFALRSGSEKPDSRSDLCMKDMLPDFSLDGGAGAGGRLTCEV